MGLYQSNFKKYQTKASKLLKDNNKVSELLQNSRTKLLQIIDKNEKLRDFADQIGTLLRMVKSYYAGTYRDFPWKSAVMFVAALLYFITPFDIIPDFIPALGLTDDVTIVVWVFNSCKEDIERFREWEQNSAVILEPEQ